MKSTGILLALLCAGLLGTSACDDAAIGVESGMDARVRVQGAQFQRGRFPAALSADVPVATPMMLPDGAVVGPPRIVTAQTTYSALVPGAVNKSVRVVASSTARSVAVGLQDDPGYWLVPVQVPSLEYENAVELTATLDFASSLEPGPLKLYVAAIDAHGQVGPARDVALVVNSSVPTAPLVVSLTWTENADLDLIVVHPDGTTLTNKATASPSRGATAGRIDLDSNANCVVDGHRTENATYTAFGDGLYKVYVRAAAACGIPLTGWTVRVLRDGAEIARAQGATYAFETDLPNGGPSGPGRLALSFNIDG